MQDWLLLAGCTKRKRLLSDRLTNYTRSNALGANSHRLVLATWQCNVHVLKVRHELASCNPSDFCTNAAEVLGLTASLDTVAHMDGLVANFAVAGHRLHSNQLKTRNDLGFRYRKAPKNSEFRYRRNCKSPSSLRSHRFPAKRYTQSHTPFYDFSTNPRCLYRFHEISGVHGYPSTDPKLLFPKLLSGPINARHDACPFRPLPFSSPARKVAGPRIAAHPARTQPAIKTTPPTGVTAPNFGTFRKTKR